MVKHRQCCTSLHQRVIHKGSADHCSNVFSIGACVCVCVCVCSLSYVQLFSTPWTVACRAPLAMHGLDQVRILEWLPLPAPDSLSTLGNKSASSESPALQVDSLTSVPLGKAPIVASKHQNSTLFMR